MASHPKTPRLQRRVVEVDSLAEFDAVSVPGASMAGWRIRHVDLTARADEFSAMRPAGALLLGCALTPESSVALEAGGALVYPDAPDAPVDEYRGTLYSPEELYEHLDRGYDKTPDALLYGWSRRRASAAPTDASGTGDVVVQVLHDASIAEALDAAIAGDGRPVVGVMGGHAVERGDAAYLDAARLGHLLASTGFLVATGGGPGAMEAANLGAALCERPAEAVDEACAALAAVASFRPSIGEWASIALDVRRRLDATAPSLGVPTWFYGHEPPNLFASMIAKFFQNSVREATLIERAVGGVVFLPGAAGTVQEVFQDACENYYADEAQVAPMVLVGVEHWTVDVPAWPLLSALAEGRSLAAKIALVDDVESAAAFVAAARANGT